MMRLAAGALVLTAAFPTLAQAAPLQWVARLAPTLPPGRSVEIPDAPPLTGFLSPPRVSRPYYLCSSVVHVEGAVPNATVELGLI